MDMIQTVFRSLLVAVLSGSPFLVSSAAASDTLERIRETGEIRIGYGRNAPFSYETSKGEIAGYSIDICRHLAAGLKERLGLDDLKTKYVYRTPSNRVQLLRDGTMDIECSASTATAERKKSVNFALSHFFVATRYVSLSKNGLSTMEDLRGRSVSVPAGTVNVGQVSKISRQLNLNMSFVVAESLQDAFDMVTSERVAAFPMDDVLLKAMIAEAAMPSRYSLSSELVAEPEPYGFMMRRGDNAFEDAVNDELEKLYASPEIDRIYDKWFRQTLPGTDINLDLQMSAKLHEWFASFR